MVLYNNKRESIVLQIMDIKFLLECYGEKNLEKIIPVDILEKFKNLYSEVLTDESFNFSLDYITEILIDSRVEKDCDFKEFINAKLNEKVLYTPDRLFGINESIAVEVLEELKEKKNIVEYKKGFHDYNKNSLSFLLGINKIKRGNCQLDELSDDKVFLLAQMEKCYGINIFNKHEQEKEKNI